ncbi:reverse transcriptase domain-containing protein, partial [Tanacetum coccineum]
MLRLCTRKHVIYSNNEVTRTSDLPILHYTRSDSVPVEMMKKPEDIKNMTIAKYMEYKAELKKQSRRKYPHYSYDAKIDTYYDLPPLLPYFQPVQPHTNYGHKPPYVDVKSVMDSMVTYKSKGNKKGHNKYAKETDKEDISSKTLPCQLPPRELNPGSFTLHCTLGSSNFYVMADLGESVNVIPKSRFEFLKLTHLKKTDMLVEMADMIKKSPIGIVQNVMVKIDKFLFPSDFVVIDMLAERNETMILGRPFLATIHAKINIFNKEISLGVGEDRITFDMDKKIRNFTTYVEKIHMINSKHDGEPCKVSIPPYKAHVRLEIKGHNNLHDQNNSIPNNEDMQGQCGKKARINKTDPTIPKVHICRPVKQDCDETFKIWPTCNTTRK